MDTVEIKQTDVFSRWLLGLRDDEARARILVRIRRLSLGNFGDVKSVGSGVFELRIHYGPGYRVYLGKLGSSLVILLAGGDKRTQDRDVQIAKLLLTKLKS